jgi:hypothetical protein
LDSEDHRGRKVNKVLLDLKETKVIQEHKDLKVRRVIKDQEARLDLRETKVILVHQGLKDLLGHKDP